MTTSPPRGSPSGWLGLEHISKFKKLDLPLDGGGKGWYYMLESFEEGGLRKVTWAIIHSPFGTRPLVARRQVEAKVNKIGDKEWLYGQQSRWQESALPEDFTGFATSGYRKTASERQKAVWQQTARMRGLDAEHEPVGRDMEAFFAIAQTRGRI
jgi:hypothetical protein